jgi:hypothetical protein
MEYNNHNNHNNQDQLSSSSKIDILILNNGWNDKNEKLIASIGENCAAFKYMHEKTASRYFLIDNVLKVIIAIISVILSSDSFFAIFEDDHTLIIFKKVILFILAFIGVIYNFLNYAQIGTQHTYYSTLFGNLYNDIRNIMCMYRKDRSNALNYIKFSIKEYDQLEISGPEIPISLIKFFKKKFKNINISMPNVLDNVKKIDVIIEPTLNAGRISGQGTSGINIKSINNMQNLSEITNYFKIDGDLSENDIVTVSDVKNLHANALKYELDRYQSQSR